MSELLETVFKVRVSTKGQVVIPKRIREALDINRGDELLLIPTKEGILMRHPPKRTVGLRGLLRDLDVDVTECEAILSEARRSLTKIVE